MTQSLLDLISDEIHEDRDEAPRLFEQSPYYKSEEMCDLLKTKQNMFSILSLNCQSLQSKFSQLQIYLHNFANSNVNFKMICLQETWLSDHHDTSLLQLDGYNFLHKPCKASTHGGTGIYLEKSIEYVVLDIESRESCWDGIFIEVHLNLNNTSLKKKVVVGNIYRPPRETIDYHKKFNEEIDEIISMLSSQNCEIILTGDFNINLLQANEKEHIDGFLEDVLLSNGLLPKITLPTRLSESSSTLIDNCFVKISDNFSKTTAGILRQKISDHQPYFVVFDYLTLKKHKSKYVKTFRSTDSDWENFRNDFNATCSLNDFNISNNCDPNENYNLLARCIKNSIDKCMPCKWVKFNKHKHKKSNWITQGIIRSISFRDRLYQRLRSTSSDSPLYNTLKTNLKTYNKILKQSIRRAKANYYNSCFLRYKQDMKNTWSTIKEIINKKPEKKDYPDKFILDNHEITTPQEIADEFNKYFVEIGPTLAGKIKTQATFDKYLTKPATTQFQFSNVDENVIRKIIKKLKPKTSSGKDSINNKMIKYLETEITPFLTLIINQSFNTGIFPEALKISKVLPIYKKDNPELFGNYRPVSILPSMSKVFERVIHDQLYEYFSSNKMFYDNQYGFRNGHSTELAAIEILDRIIRAMDRKEIPINVFLDLSKAFDTLDHNVLIKKLEYYGVSGTSLNLMLNYLTNRRQYVLFGETTSDMLTIQTGVPQGSILGPLLFIIYLNDLVHVCKTFKPVIYADDTTLFAVLESFETEHTELAQNINSELELINTWFKANKLSVNGKKTKAMLFHSVNKKVPNVQIKMDMAEIEFVKEFNYLGITFDQNISWKPHLLKVTKKISRTLGVMSKLKHMLPTHILKTLYDSLVLPHIMYGLLVWSTGSARLEITQKKAVRIITAAKFNAHTEPIFKKLNILKIEDMVKLQELKFLYKLENGTLPKYFRSSDILIRQADIHSHDTRNAEDYRTPQSRLCLVSNSICYNLPEISNKCPDEIKPKIFTHSYYGYSEYIKKFLLNKYKAV